MLIHRHGQYSTVGRVISWVARQLSLALVVVTALPLVTQAMIVCLGDSDFVQRCVAALEDIRNTTPVGQASIARLEQAQQLHVIVETDGVDHVVAADLKGAYDLDSGGTGMGSSTLIYWNPTDSSVLEGRGITDPKAVLSDPNASLLHEVYHASVASDGGWSMSLVPGTHTQRQEIDATQVENEYRKEEGLPLRTKYDDAAVPAPSESPPPPECDPAIEMCEQPPPKMEGCEDEEAQRRAADEACTDPDTGTIAYNPASPFMCDPLTGDT
jgi:hypothetical protein